RAFRHRARPAALSHRGAGLPRPAEDDLSHHHLPDAGLLPRRASTITHGLFEHHEQFRKTVTEGLATMPQTLFVVVMVIVGILTNAMPTAAQEMVAEIETWRSTAIKVTQPALDVLYTIIPAPILTTTGTAAPGSGTTQQMSSAGTARSVALTAIGA